MISSIFNQIFENPVSARHAMKIVGVMLVVVGLIRFLQGINVQPGSFMTDKIRWAVYGAIVGWWGSVAYCCPPRGRAYEEGLWRVRGGF